MKNLSVVAISGSPSGSSKTALAAEYILDQLSSPDVLVRHFRIRDIDPRALLSADITDQSLREVQEAIASAQGVIVATPTFKSSYSGLLKAFLDSLPQFALAGKAVLPLATGGSLAHVLALDYGLRPVLQSMGARHVVQGHFLPESDLSVEDGKLSLSEASKAPLMEAVANFRYTLTSDERAQLLGHPRPQLEPAT